MTDLLSTWEVTQDASGPFTLRIYVTGQPVSRQALESTTWSDAIKEARTLAAKWSLS